MDEHAMEATRPKALGCIATLDLVHGEFDPYLHPHRRRGDHPAE